MLIAADANIWIKEFLFRSGMGVAFIHGLDQLDAKLLLLDFTRTEITNGLLENALADVDSIESARRRLQSIVGGLRSHDQISSETIQSAINNRFGELNKYITTQCIPLEIFQSALNRVLRHAPPSSKTREEYRDCLLWEILKASEETSKVLITNDHHFLEGKGDPRKLSTILQEESRNKIQWYSSIGDFLSAFSKELVINKTAVVESLKANLVPILVEYIEARGGLYGELMQESVKAYATDDPKKKIVSFAFRCSAVNLDRNGDYPEDGWLRCTGEAITDSFFNVTDLKLEEIQVFGLSGFLIPELGTQYVHLDFMANRSVPVQFKREIPISD